MNKHVVVVGLGFGDEGKGTIVDYLTSRYFPEGPRAFDTVVRYNGGAQAGHNVVDAAGRHHVFSQFGSGFFNGAMTHLSQHMLVNPLAMVTESEALGRLSVGVPLSRITIDRRALLTTPFHIEGNREREIQRGADRHGSVGMGIGETVAFWLKHPADAPTVADTQDLRMLRRKLWSLHDYYTAEFPDMHQPPIDMLVSVYRQWANDTKIVDEYFLPTILRHQRVLFEGAQGVLLDQDFGFHPYTTWSKTTAENALALLREADAADDVTILGVTRAYSTRHGAGPFPAQDDRLSGQLPDTQNGLHEWQGNFRIGHLDALTLRYAATVLGRVDEVAVTNLDRNLSGVGVVTAYRGEGDKVIDELEVPEQASRPHQEFLTALTMKAWPVVGPMPDPVATVERATDSPVTIRSNGASTDKKAYVRVREVVLA
jgi:adenylosuccinate synthase